MNWLESIIYGAISGFAEILPISSAAHQELMKRLFGVEGNVSFQDMLVHVAILAVLLYSCRETIGGLNSRPAASSSRGRRSAVTRRPPDLRVVRTAAVPLLLSFLLYPTVSAAGNDLLMLVLILIINGIILYVPSRMLHGNKDARAMSGWDSLLIGIGGALGVLPGISRVGAATAAAAARGADRQNALNWALLMSIPALVVLIAIDVFGVIAGGIAINSVAAVLNCFLSLAGACGGGYLGIMLMRFLAVKTGFSGFAYYSWGAALFSFIMYLTVV